jgi:hypothetical protein
LLFRETGQCTMFLPSSKTLCDLSWDPRITNRKSHEISNISKETGPPSVNPQIFDDSSSAR